RRSARALALMEMQDLLQRLTEVSIRQQQIVEHLATRQGRTEEQLAAIRVPAAQHVPLPDPRAQATRLLPKMTAYNDVEAFLQVFESTATREGWAAEEWALALAPLLTGVFLAATSRRRELRRSEAGNSSSAWPRFHDWEYKARVPTRAQAAELARIAQHWLLEGEPTAAQVVERMVIDRLLRALPRSHRQAVGMRNPTTILELVEAIELADAVQHWEAGDRAPPFPRRVVQERCAPQGTPRTVGRPAVPSPQDEPMPTAEHKTPPRTWLAGCTVHQSPPPAAPEVDTKLNGKPMRAILDSGSAVTFVQSRLCPPHPGQKSLFSVTCVHGDTRQVPARRVTISTAHGAWPTFLLARLRSPASRRRPARQPAGEPPPSQATLRTSAGEMVSPPPKILFYDVFQQASGGGSFAKEQQEDDHLKHCWAQVRVTDNKVVLPRPHSLLHFIVRRGLLYCVAQRRGEEKELLVVPRSKTETILELAHSHPMAGHLGATNTIQRIRDRFHWPGLDTDVKAFCQACPTCQITAPRTPPPSPLIPLPIIEVPFERIGLDLVGPLPKSARGHKHILVIVDYATRYPEAVPLRKATAKAIAQELFLLASRVGIPAEILTDQGTPFMSRLMADLCRLLRVKQVAAEDKRDWDLMIPYVMFSIREVPQASTCFNPFELLFGRQPRGLLDVAREAWEQQPAPHRTVVEHSGNTSVRLNKLNNATTTGQPNHGNSNRETVSCKFLASWQGPYTVAEKVGPVTNHLHQPGRRRSEQLYHINLLKRWNGTRDQIAALSLTDPVVVDINPHLSAAQKAELQHLVGQFPDVFSSRPGQTNVIQHDIRTPPGVIVRQRPYRVPEACRQAIEEEVQEMLKLGVQEMLKLGVIEPSRCPWSSPIVMVPKPDGTLRFCNDFRRLNEVSQFDGYPMPRVDELLDRLGRARYITTLDLTKGYWQVPLTPTAKEKTAFSTPRGRWQYRTLPFGLHGAPATFQRMMDIILRPPTWTTTIWNLRRAGLTANPRKCHLAQFEAKYLGFQVGRGLIHPQEKKVEAIRTAPKPETKTQVRAFLGLAGYYRCFIPNFSTLAAPLTDLTRKGQPEKIRWTAAAEEALAKIKTALTSSSVLRAPDFSCPFLLQTDASDTGEEHPIIYISRKLSPAERNYATVEREALAIKWAVLELRYYLLGRKFTLVTDHAPLQWMARAKDTNARVTRWFLALQDFHFEVPHRAGVTNTNADGLSRIWTAYAGLSGVIPHPPLISPLL
ncbi:hypothetical protein M9458_029148, partial [Cirrhinus mrigala]